MSNLNSLFHTHQAYIAVGANQPYKVNTPLENISAALKVFERHEIKVTAVSRPWRTPAWPDPSQPEYVNGIIEVSAKLPAISLLEKLLFIEGQFGRVRTAPNAPRTLDLDIIDYGSQVRSKDEQSNLTLPHPRLEERAFVLLPLRDIAPDWCHPVTGISLDHLIARLPRDDINACTSIDDTHFSVSFA